MSKTPPMEPKPQNANNDQAQNPRRFESDAQKVVRRHLEDKNHVITEEEIRNVRIGILLSGDNADPAGNAAAPRESPEP